MGARTITRPRSRAGRGVGGYILFEALIALTVLSVTIYVIQDGIRQAVIARGQAQDFTQARFLLEDLVNQLQLQPLFQEEQKSGRFSGANGRFSWRYRIAIVDLPVPPAPPSRTVEPATQDYGSLPNFPGYQRQQEAELQLPVPFLGKIDATISWSRSGSPFEVSVQTLFAPERMWLPPPPPETPAVPGSAPVPQRQQRGLGGRSR